MPNDLLLLLGVLGIVQVAKERPKLPPDDLRPPVGLDLETDLSTGQYISAWWPDEEEE